MFSLPAFWRSAALKLTRLGIACLWLCAALCAAQSSAPQTAPETDAKPAQQQPGTGAGQSGASQTAPGNPQPPPDQSKSQENKSQKEKTQEQTTGTSNDRLLFALPNFLTLENGTSLPPLTPGQKFKVVARGSFDYVQIPWYGFQAGISQAENSEEGYGQGAAGYAKRFGAAAGDGTIENFMTGAIFPTVFHEDPRYFQLGKGSFLHRAGYSISRIVITRTDSGHKRFNISEIFGSALAAGISTYSYHPKADKTIANTANVWGTEVAYDTLTIVIKEFWPDIRRAIKKKK